MPSKNPSTNNFFLASIISLTLLGCATKEEIKTRETVSLLKGDMVGQQRITKNLLLKLQNIENNLGLVSGKIEETQHDQEITEQNSIKDLEKRIQTIEQDRSKFVLDTNAEISKIYQEINEQKKFLKKILSEIKKASGSETTLSLFSQSIRNYQAKKFKTAKSQFIEIVNDLPSHRLSLRDQALVFHNLGMSFFIENDFENSQIYFSKLFSNYPKSPLNSSGLFHLGMALKNQNKSKEALSMWKLLLTKYPKSNYSTKAKKEMDKK